MLAASPIGQGRIELPTLGFSCKADGHNRPEHVKHYRDGKLQSREHQRIECNIHPQSLLVYPEKVGMQWKNKNVKRRQYICRKPHVNIIDALSRHHRGKSILNIFMPAVPLFSKERLDIGGYVGSRHAGKRGDASDIYSGDNCFTLARRLAISVSLCLR